MLNLLFLASVALRAAVPTNDALSADGHRLIAAEHFEQADAMAQAVLTRSNVAGEAGERRRLDAINVLIDSAIAQHTLTGAACGGWIDEATKLDVHIFGEQSRRVAKAWAAASLRARRSATGPADIEHANALAQQAVERVENGSGDIAASDEAFVYQAATAMQIDGGHFDKAIADLQHAHASLANATTDYERSIDAQVLSLLGTYELQVGNRAQSITDTNAGVELALHVGGSSSRLYAATLADLGKVQVFTADFVGAKETLEHALTILHNIPAENYTACIANGFLANALLQLGDVDAARPYGRAAIDNAKGDAAGFLSGRLNSLAVVEKLSGHLDVSHDLFEQALAADERLHEKNYYGLVPMLNNLGVLSLKRDDLVAAQSEFQRALDIAAARGGGGVVYDMLSAREGLASVALGRAEPGEADTLLAQSIDELERSYGDGHPDITFLRCEQALAKARLGHRDEAFALAQNSEGFRVDLLLSTAPALGEGEMVNLKSRVDDCQGLVAALAASSQKDDQVQRAWQLLAASRGIATHLSSLRLAAARKATDASNKDAWSAWESAAKHYAELLLRNKVDAETLSKARVTLEAAESQLGSAGHPALSVAALALPTLLNRQATGSVLVAYFVTDQFDLEADARSDPQVHHLVKSPHAVYAFVRQNGATKFLSLGDSEKIEFKIAYWNRLLRDPKSNPDQVSEAGRAVRAAIWDPLAIGKTSRRIFVVPDGALYRVNFAALPDGDGYLVERGLRVHLLDSERDLAMNDSSARPQKLVLIGSPDFGGDVSATYARSDGCATAFDPLPATQTEMNRIAQMWRDASGTTPTILSGRDANKDALRAAVAGSQVIHVATHAAEFDESCSHTAARGMGIATPLKTAALKPVALALSGANEFLANGNAAGILTSEEVLALPLDNTRWVVLSACDTGLGPVVDGEGVFGLRRAFRLAGARTVVMSLWEADDVATAQWMEALYRARLQKHASVPEAIAQAQLSVLADRRARGVSTHPYFWAAFVASGDWH
ncbi:MAG TPA: CHAT domain-containing tetratricopeptide repeat protein [Rudaea sp.]|jgi:CHAT domain-containing protein|nr:CHAT domain-containing tetratricopeptide repeat protein [Rudaea sp.]